MSATFMKPGTATTPSHSTGPTRDAAVESWRVVTESAGGTPPTSDAVVRLRSGNDRLLVTGEAETAEAALLGAVQTARRMTPGRVLDLGGTLSAHLKGVRPMANVRLEAANQKALVGRLAVLLNAHDVASFSYRVDAEQNCTRVEILVNGGDGQVSRVAQKLRRVIGVLRVTADLADGRHDTPPAQ